MFQTHRFVQRTLASLLAILITFYSVPPDTFALTTDSSPLTEEAHSAMGDKSAVVASSSSAVSYNDGNTFSNDYLEVFTSSNGRFTVGTIQGNPDYASDNNKILLFGHPGSDTSFTTIMIDNTSYIFEASQSTVSANQSISTMTIDGIKITQKLEFFLNSSTGIADTVKVSYTTENVSSTSKSVGVRIMLDTMLGENDGAPFKVPSIGEVITEKELSGTNVPQFWQAFDSLVEPSVFAVGTFYQSGDIKPDKVQFTNWGDIYDEPWGYVVTPSKSITNDSAVAAYWNPTIISAGGSREVNTYYGVGYTGNSDSVTSAPIEYDQFGVIVFDGDTNEVISNPTITAKNQHTSNFTYISLSDGLVTGISPLLATDPVEMTVSAPGYTSETVTQTVSPGYLTGVTLYKSSSPNSFRIGTVKASYSHTNINNVDLLSSEIYFNNNADNVGVLTNRSNVKTLIITATSTETASKYQLIQNNQVKAESTTGVFNLDVLIKSESLTATEYSKGRLVDFEPGQVITIKAIKSDGTSTSESRLGLSVTNPEPDYFEYTNSVSMGDKFKVTLDDDIPIIGGGELTFGWNNIFPCQIDISENGHVKVALNVSETMSPDKWNTFKEDYNEAMEATVTGRSNAAAAYKGSATSFGAGKFSIKGNLMGYGEGYLNEAGDLIVEVGVIAKISAGADYTYTVFLGWVPVYVAVGGKVELATNTSIESKINEDGFNIIKGEIKLEPSITLNIDGGVGANGVFNIGASGRGKLGATLTSGTEEPEGKAKATLSLYAVAKAWLVEYEKKFAETSYSWDLNYGSSRSSDMSYPSNDIASYYEADNFQLASRDYLSFSTARTTDPNTVASNVFYNASPKLVELGSTKYLFWLADDETKDDLNRSSLVYSTQTGGNTWSDPIDVFNDGFADFAFQPVVVGNTINILVERAAGTIVSNSDDALLALMAENTEIVLVELGVSPTNLSNNSTTDMMSDIAEVGSDSVAAWVASDQSDPFDTSANHSIYYSEKGGVKTSIPPILGLVLELAVGELDGSMAIAYVLDEDNDYETVEDRSLYLFQNGSSKKIETGLNPRSLVFAEEKLYWSCQSQTEDTDTTEQLLSLTSYNGTITSKIFDGNNTPDNFYGTFQIESERLTWVAQDLSSEEDYYHIYACDLSSTTPYLLLATETNSSFIPTFADDMVSYMDIGVNINDATSDAALKRDRSNLMAVTIDSRYDLALVGVDFDSSDVKNNTNLPINLTVYNQGNVSYNGSLPVKINGVNSTLTGINLAPGETQNLEATYGVPTLVETTPLVIELVPTGDVNSENNQQTLSYGFTDLAVEGEFRLIDGQQYLLIRAENLTEIPTDAQLYVRSDNADGAVLYSRKLEGITSTAAGSSFLVPMDALDSTGQINVLYVTLESTNTTAEEYRIADNVAILYNQMTRSGNQSYVVTFDANGGTTNTTNTTTGTDGTLSSLPTPTRSDYTFNGWYTSATDGTKITTDTVFTENTTVYAQWTSSGTSGGGSSGGGSSGSGSGTTTMQYYIYTQVQDENGDEIGGSIKTSKSKAEEGTEITITVTTEEGYYLKSLQVITEDGGRITAKFGDDGNYLFTMRDDVVTVVATFALGEGDTELEPEVDSEDDSGEIFPEQVFYDVKTSDWFYPYVKYALENGLMTGMGDSRFGPEEDTLRAMIVTVLYSMADKPMPTNPTLFDDVKNGDYFQLPCLWAREVGVVSGMGDNLFAPELPVSREQICAMLYKYALTQTNLVTGTGANSSFTDNSDISIWASTAVNWCSSVNVVGGYDDGSFKPQESANRGEIATMLMKFSLLLK